MYPYSTRIARVHLVFLYIAVLVNERVSTMLSSYNASSLCRKHAINAFVSVPRLL